MELIVVLVIISVMVAFAVPEFSQKVFRDDTKIAINWLVQNIGKLKKDAKIQGKDLVMCIQPGTRIIQIQEKMMGEQSLDQEDVTDYALPEDVNIDTVEITANTTDNELKPCIRFFKKGYSDQAIIHLSNSNGENFSIVIQPFLHSVQTHQGFFQFD